MQQKRRKLLILYHNRVKVFNSLAPSILAFLKKMIKINESLCLEIVFSAFLMNFNIKFTNLKLNKFVAHYSPPIKIFIKNSIDKLQERKLKTNIKKNFKFKNIICN